MHIKEYNGWANYETWNVALWIGNDEGLYNMAKEFKHQGYKAFAEYLKDFADPTDETVHQIAYETPDNVLWTYEGLDFKALDNMLEELG